jgi:hypothetical protein
MANTADRELARLRDDWPRREFWTVRKHIGGTVWCARRADDHKVVLNAASPAGLAGYLEDQAGR